MTLNVTPSAKMARRFRRVREGSRASMPAVLFKRSINTLASMRRGQMVSANRGGCGAAGFLRSHGRSHVSAQASLAPAQPNEPFFMAGACSGAVK
jgi:hypothetical protein